ncbi:unnamed protein product [Symbiodinium sp. CCMP2592]|nr:unnamed protein product [Symbiodinium sp. CCMP2592]
MVNKAVQVGKCGLKAQSKARPRRLDTNATENPEEAPASGPKDTRAEHDDLRRQAADAVLTTAPWKRRQKARAGTREPATDGVSEGSARPTTTSANPVASMTPLPTTTTSRQGEATGKNAAASSTPSKPLSKVPYTAAGADPQEEIMELRFDQLQEMQRSAASRRNSVIQRARIQQQQNASSSTDVADASLSHAPTTVSNASSAYMKKRPPYAALSCLACFILCGYIAPVTGLYMVLLMYWWTFAGIVPARSAPLAIVARCLRGAYKMQCPLIHIFLSGYDELAQWLNQPSTLRNVQIVFLQETWRSASEFSTQNWHWILSGAGQTAKANNGSGVAVLINNKLASSSHIRYQEWLPGRLLEVRITEAKRRPLLHRPITLVCAYQHSRISHSPEVYAKRLRFWEKLQKCLDAVPTRHTLIFGGDINTGISPMSRLVGKGAQVSTNPAQDQSEWQDQPVDAIMHPMHIDAILRHGSQELFPGTRLGSRPTEVWDNEQTKLSLKHVWQARAQLRRHTLGPPLRVAFHLWRAHWRLVKARKALHSQSNKARRDKWDQQLTEAEEAYHKHDSHSFFAIEYLAQHWGEGEHAGDEDIARQGCMLAPCLWLLFVTYLFHHLDTTMGGADSWTCQHSTAFADDLHFKWDLDDPKALDRMKMEVATVLSVLKSFGLQISAEKSTMLIEIRGTAADVWLSKNVYKDAENNKHFRYDTFAKLSIPLGTQFKYLGVILSYRNYELASVKHRVQQAAIHHSRLRRILQGRGGISRHQRLRLWRICIQTSQLYGLEATGVTEAGIKLLHVQMLRHLRAITGRPRHLDRSTDQELLDSLKMASVRQMLSQRLQSANTRLCSNTDLPCYDKDNILRRIQALQAGIDQPICTQRVSTALTTPVQQTPHDDVTPQEQKVRLQELPADTKQFRCQVCGQSFPSLHLVKTHEGKAHKILAPKRELPQDRSVYSINGLPQCRFCGYKFTKWSGLQRHIQRNGCPILRHEDPATFAATAPATTNKAEDPLRTTQHAWVADSTIATTMPSTGDQPLVQDAQLQQDASKYTWTKVLHMWRTKHDFTNVCVFCGQWAVDASALKQHYAKQHQALTNPWIAAYRAECKQLAKVAVSKCRFCGTTTTDARQHAHKCIHVFQAYMLTSHVSGRNGGHAGLRCRKPDPEPPRGPLLSSGPQTTSESNANTGAQSVPSDQQASEGGTVDSRHREQGRRQGQRMASNGTLSQEDLQQLLRQIVVLLLRQGDQLNRLQTDTGYYLVFQVPGDATMVPVLIAGALEWRNQKKADPTKLTMSLRIALIGLFLKELQMRLEKIRANDQLQEKLKEQGLMTDEGAWTYRQWCPKNKALQLQLSRD